MIQRAGIATFPLPDSWTDYSAYSYYSPDKLSNITLMLDSEIEETTADDVIKDRLEAIQTVLPAFRLEQPIAPITIAGREGRTVTFSSQEDGDEIKKARLTVVILAPRLAFVATVQSTYEKWPEVDLVWRDITSNLTLEQKNPPSIEGEPYR